MDTSDLTLFCEYINLLKVTRLLMRRTESLHEFLTVWEIAHAPPNIQDNNGSPVNAVTKIELDAAISYLYDKKVITDHGIIISQPINDFGTSQGTALPFASLPPAVNTLSPAANTLSLTDNTLSPAVHTLLPAVRTLWPTVSTFSPAVHTLSPVVSTLSPAGNSVDLATSGSSINDERDCSSYLPNSEAEPSEPADLFVCPSGSAADEDLDQWFIDHGYTSPSARNSTTTPSSDDLFSLPTYQHQQPQISRQQGSKWSEEEIAIVKAGMMEIQQTGKFAADRQKHEQWGFLAEKLRASGFHRKEHGIRMWWNRYGRAETGIDERSQNRVRAPLGNDGSSRSLATSKQSAKPTNKRKRDGAGEQTSKRQRSDMHWASSHVL